MLRTSCCTRVICFTTWSHGQEETRFGAQCSCEIHNCSIAANSSLPSPPFQQFLPMQMKLVLLLVVCAVTSTEGSIFQTGLHIALAGEGASDSYSLEHLCSCLHISTLPTSSLIREKVTGSFSCMHSVMHQDVCMSVVVYSFASV